MKITPLDIGYAQVINQRLQLLLSAEAIYMTGLLSTPFHRVYFADQNKPDIERLPDNRLKIPLSLPSGLKILKGIIFQPCLSPIE